MTVLAEAISRSLIHFVWQGALVGLLLSITLLPLRKRSAKARYALSCLALAVLGILPVATTLYLYNRPVLQQASFTPATAAAAVPFPSPATAAAPENSWLVMLQSWALPVWSLGVAVFSLRLLWGYAHVWKLGRDGRGAEQAIQETVGRLAARMGIERPVRVLISSLSDSPSVVGWLRPVILLPAATLIGLTPVQLEAVLAHELAHIKRFDYLVNIIQMLAETLLFYHPAVWWTSRRIRIERELCCDDLAVGSCGDAISYARALSTLEKLRLSPGVAMSSTGGPLLYRIQRLVGAASHEYGPSRLPAILAVSLGLVCVALNVNWVQGRPQPPAAGQEIAKVQNPSVRDAAGVTVDLAASSVIHRTPVAYPEAARKQGVTGVVQVEVKLDSDGEVADAKVLSGPEELRKAALQSVLSWHFTRDAGRSTRLVNISFQPPPPGTEQAEPEGETLRAFAFTDKEGVTRGYTLAVEKADIRALEEQKRAFLEDADRLKLIEAENKVDAIQKMALLDRALQEAEIQKQQAVGADQLARAAAEIAAIRTKMQNDQASPAEVESLQRKLELKVQDEGKFRADSIIAQRRVLEAQMDALKARAQQNPDQADSIIAQRRALEAQMAALKARMQQNPDEREQLALQLREVQKMFEATPFPGRIETNMLVGHAVKSISTPNLPSAVRNDLLSRLPVREGDMLSSESMEQTAKAVRSFDEHLEIRFLPTKPDGQVEIRITAPGERR